MSVVKIGNRTDKPFAQIDNRLLNDPRLSWRAKGILCYLLSKPQDWTIVADHIVRQGTEGRDAVRTAFRELRTLGYAELRLERTATGEAAGSVWTVHETPVRSSWKDGTRQPDNPSPEKPEACKPSSTNTDCSKKVRTKKEVVEIEIPETLKSDPQFIEAWEEYHEYRKEKRKPMLPRSRNKQLKFCAELGPRLAIAAINETIRHGWDGLFPPKENGFVKPTPRPYRNGNDIESARDAK